MFSEEELERLRGFPEISGEALLRFFTLTPAEVEFIAPGRGRGPADRLGLAIQLCTLPWLGFVPDDVGAAPTAAVARLSERLAIPIGELRFYGHREQTRTDHLGMVARYLGWRQAGPLELAALDEVLLARAMEHDSPTLLFRLAGEQLISSHVIRRGVVTLVGRVAKARAAASWETFDRVAHLLTRKRQEELDALLVVDAAIGTTRLAWLGRGPTEASAAAVKAELGKLRYLRSLDAHTLDLSTLPAARRRFLAAVGRRLSAQALARREPERRHPILLLLAQSASDVLDEVIQLFEPGTVGRESLARHRMIEQLAERAKSGEDCQALLDDILAIVTDPAIPDEAIGALIRGDRIGWERLTVAVAMAPARLPRDHRHLARVATSYLYLRQFSPG